MSSSKMRSRSVSRSRAASMRRRPSVKPREKIKDCCRKLVAFMCTQVGVGGLIVGYAVVGAFGFMSIEGDKEPPVVAKVEMLRRNVTQQLWDVISTDNVFNHTTWIMKSADILRDFQEGISKAAKEEKYDGRSAEEVWSFPAALMFCLSVFTMIGYGNTVPRTPLGKSATVVYAVFGIPLYVLYFMNMGKVLATAFKWIYTKIYVCGMKEDEEEKRIIVPSTACLWVLGAYIATGTIMFAEWERWNYLDSTYFCVTSLCKIGIGDFVPGANIAESKGGRQTKLVINFVYLLLGMGLVAMCYNLMREVVRVRLSDLKRDILLCIEDFRLKIMSLGPGGRRRAARARSRSASRYRAHSSRRESVL